MRIQLLGGFNLVSGDEPVAGVNAPRLQSLLAYLLLHRDAPQPRQHLAFVFWPDASEAQGRNNLRQTLHALRLSLPNSDTLLHVDANSVRWRPDVPLQLDVAEFERALAGAEAAGRQGRVIPARVALERAVSLYEADLLPGCFDEWVQPERERLRLNYAQALGRLVELLDTQRDYPAAIRYARRLALHDPLNEDACRRLMRLLALQGDRVEALRVYHACASALERELRIAPSVETTQLYERLLRADGALAPAGERRSVLSVTQALVGRQREWERLQGAWRSSAGGEPGFVLITGEAGIGKSRLAEEMVLWASQRNAITAKTRCYPAEGRLSLAPVTEWLRSDMLRPSLARLDRVWLAEVARLLPELSSEYPNLPPYEPISEYGQRQRFFEALARAIVGAHQPLLLVIDDLQWCDQETLEWLHFLLRFDPSARLLLVGTARDEELTPEHPLRALMLDVPRTTALTEIALRPLDAAETAKLAALFADREFDVTLAMRLYHETEGNPLFVVETMRTGLDLPDAHGPHAHGPHARDGAATHASDDASDGTADDASVSPPLPPRVRAVIAARLARLSPPARELASLAATIGREFRLDVVLRASKTEEDESINALDELWQRRIVRDHGAAAYDFTHDKLREVAYCETGVAQRRLLHRRIAGALEAVHAGDLDPVSGQIASHYERAGAIDQALPYFYQAAEVARRVYANEDAITLLTRALALLDQLPAGAARDTLELRALLMLAPIYRITRGWTAPELERVVRRSLTLCDALGADAERAEALYGWEALLVVQAKLDDVLLVDEDLHALYERSRHPAPPLTDMMVAGTRLHLGHIVEANDLFERMITAYDPSRPVDRQDMLGWNLAVHARAWQAHSLWSLGYPDQALSRGLEAVQVARDLVLPFNQALASTYLAMLQQLLSGRATAKASAEEAATFTAAYRAPYYRAWSAILVSYAETSERPTTANLSELRHVIEAFKASGARLRLPYYLWLLASCYGKAGRSEEGLAILDEAFAAARASNERWWNAELHRLRGELLRQAHHNDDAVEAALLRAAEIARSQCARSLELRAAMSLARWWSGRNRKPDARRQLSGAYAWFTEGFDTRDLLAARSLLAELA